VGTAAETYLYGDGSAGDLVVSATATWNSTAPQNLRFRNLTINAGVTLTVVSGLELKVTGTFINNGTIVVMPWGGAGYQDSAEEPNSTGTATNIQVLNSVLPDRGVGLSAASNGFTTRRATSTGTSSASQLSFEQARRLVRVGAAGGGGGGGGGPQAGGRGGGTLTVLAGTLIRNTGLISANGESSNYCAGGGAGGVVVLASATSVEPGSIEAKGGGGGNVFSNLCSGGGGGGGGLIHVVAPSVAGGTFVVTAGSGGTSTLAARAAVASSGGNGGACGGYGGVGGTLAATLTSGTMGGQGQWFATQANPAFLFF
jgi:hypothetical protein